MADIGDKRRRALTLFRGRKVRRKFSDGRYSECVGVNVYGPPSGWTCVYELVLKTGGNIKVERLSDVVIKPEKLFDSSASP